MGTVGDLAQRLAAAAATLREHEAISQQKAKLHRWALEAEQEVTTRRYQHTRCLAAAARPKGRALARITAMLRGTGGRDLAGQRAAAQAAGRQLREAETRLLLARRQFEQVTAALAVLAPALHDATAVLAQRQRQLSHAGGWVAERLRQLQGEHQRLASQWREAERAQHAAARAREALARACDQLSPSPRWPTYSNPFGALYEVSRLDKAVTAAAEADRYLSRVPAQLAEADIGGPLAPRLPVSCCSWHPRANTHAHARRGKAGVTAPELGPGTPPPRRPG